MRYELAFRYFVGRSNGLVSLLLATVCLLIPAIGPIVLLGYQAKVAERLIRDPNLRAHPRFDFDQFVDYLTRGVWPFVISLLISLASVVVVILPAVAIVAATAAADMLVVGAIVAAVILVVGTFGTAMVAWPWGLYAELTARFDLPGGWRFVKDFWSLLGVRAFLSILAFWLLGSLVGLLGMLACFVGVYPASIVVQMAGQHLLVQHYLLYLEAGGTPIDGHIPPYEEIDGE